MHAKARVSSLALSAFLVAAVPATGAFGYREWARLWAGDALGWTATDVAVDANGDVYVVGYNYVNGYGLVKYAPPGALLWQKALAIDLGTATEPRVAVDPDGNVILSGSIEDPSSGQDLLTIKYSPAGAIVWSRQFDSGPGWQEYAGGLAVDSSGNVYVAGRKGQGYARDVLTVKYSPGGDLLWSATWTASPGDDMGHEVAVAADGSVYVAASSTGFGTDDDILLIKYSPTGIEQWVRHYNGCGTDWCDDWPSNLAVDSVGNAYVVGYSQPVPHGGHILVTFKFAANGDRLWVRPYDDSRLGGGGDLGIVRAGLAVDGAGNVHVAARSHGGATGYDYVTVKYAPDGTQSWQARLEGAFRDEARDLVLDGDGNVYVTGVSGDDEYFSERSWLTLQYSAAGALLWSDRYNPGNRGAANALARDASGNVYVAGEGETWERFYSEALTVKYAASPPPVSLSIGDVTVTEGGSGTRMATFAVALSAAAGQAVSVSYATADGTATAGSDYVPASGPLAFPPGTTVLPISVTVNGDTTVEPDETFTVNLSAATGATILDGQGLGTIVNDDSASLSIDDVSVTEGDSGTTTATFTVTLSSASAQTVTVSYTTADGTATTGDVDYVGGSGSVTFAPGQTARPVHVTVNGDTRYEANESFYVDLGSPVNATIAGGRGVGTITNDDAAPVLLTVVLGGVGAGRVTSSPTGIDCGADCTESYAPATVVTLTAAPDEGSIFEGWSGSACLGTAPTCPVTMSVAQSVTATFSPDPWTDFFTVTPCRVADTRGATGPSGGPILGGSSIRSFPVAGGACGIPATALAVSVNLTAVGAAAAGYLTLYPGDAASPPLSSSVNFSAGVTRANNAIVPLSGDGTGTLKVKNGSVGAVHFVLDVNGYFQ